LAEFCCFVGSVPCETGDITAIQLRPAGNERGTPNILGETIDARFTN
jgi:hypothetical protein